MRIFRHDAGQVLDSKPLRPFMAQAVHLANMTAGMCLDAIVVADPHVQRDFQRVTLHKAIVYYNFPMLSLFTPAPAEPSVAQADLVYIGGMSDRSGCLSCSMH